MTLVERLQRLVDLKRKYPDGTISAVVDLSQINGHSITFYDYNAEDIAQLIQVNKNLNEALDAAVHALRSINRDVKNTGPLLDLIREKRKEPK